MSNFSRIVINLFRKLQTTDNRILVLDSTYMKNSSLRRLNAFYLHNIVLVIILSCAPPLALDSILYGECNIVFMIVAMIVSCHRLALLVHSRLVYCIL